MELKNKNMNSNLSKIKKIYILILSLVFCVCTSCTTRTEPSTSTVSEQTQLNATNLLDANTTFNTQEIQDKSDNYKQVLSKYLEYLHQNKDDIIMKNAEQYKIQFYNTYGSDTPEMVIETKTVPEIDNGRDYYCIYHHYYSLSNTNIEQIDWRYESYYIDRNESYDFNLVIDLTGNYNEIITTKYPDCIFIDKNIVGDFESSIDLFSSYSVNSSAELRDCMVGFLLPYVNEYPDDMYEQNLNPDTGKYEMYIISQEVIDSIGEVDYIEPTFNFNSYAVTKEVYENVYEKYMSQFKEVTDITKYTSDCILVEHEIDTDKILDEACAVFEE